jgi:hypothetical protein
VAPAALRCPPSRWLYGVDVPAMSLELHECGIHALCPDAREARLRG